MICGGAPHSMHTPHSSVLRFKGPRAHLPDLARIAGQRRVRGSRREAQVPHRDRAGRRAGRGQVWPGRVHCHAVYLPVHVLRPERSWVQRAVPLAQSARDVIWSLASLLRRSMEQSQYSVISSMRAM